MLKYLRESVVRTPEFADLEVQSRSSDWSSECTLSHLTELLLQCVSLCDLQNLCEKQIGAGWFLECPERVCWESLSKESGCQKNYKLAFWTRESKDQSRWILWFHPSMCWEWQSSNGKPSLCRDPICWWFTSGERATIAMICKMPGDKMKLFCFTKLSFRFADSFYSLDSFSYMKI